MTNHSASFVGRRRQNGRQRSRGRSCALPDLEGTPHHSCISPHRDSSSGQRLLAVRHDTSRSRYHTHLNSPEQKQVPGPTTDALLPILDACHLPRRKPGIASRHYLTAFRRNLSRKAPSPHWSLIRAPACPYPQGSTSFVHRLSSYIIFGGPASHLLALLDISHKSKALATQYSPEHSYVPTIQSASAGCRLQFSPSCIVTVAALRELHLSTPSRKTLPSVGQSLQNMSPSISCDHSQQLDTKHYTQYHQNPAGRRRQNRLPQNKTSTANATLNISPPSSASASRPASRT